MKIIIWIIAVLIGVAWLVNKLKRHKINQEKKYEVFEPSYSKKTTTIEKTTYSNNLVDKYEQLRELKRQGENKEAIKLALQLVEETEAENEQLSWGVAPAPYRELAILYRKEKDPIDI